MTFKLVTRSGHEFEAPEFETVASAETYILTTQVHKYDFRLLQVGDRTKTEFDWCPACTRLGAEPMKEYVDVGVGTQEFLVGFDCPYCGTFGACYDCGEWWPKHDQQKCDSWVRLQKRRELASRGIFATVWDRLEDELV